MSPEYFTGKGFEVVGGAATVHLIDGSPRDVPHTTSCREAATPTP
jgi:hypothetical protein